MSWGATGSYKDGVLEFALESNVQTDEHAQQFTVAKEAVRDLVDSGAFGEGEFSVSLSGHGNPNHEKTPGWANDFISITVTQK